MKQWNLNNEKLLFLPMNSTFDGKQTIFFWPESLHKRLWTFLNFRYILNNVSSENVQKLRKLPNQKNKMLI